MPKKSQKSLNCSKTPSSQAANKQNMRSKKQEFKDQLRKISAGTSLPVHVNKQENMKKFHLNQMDKKLFSNQNALSSANDSKVLQEVLEVRNISIDENNVDQRLDNFLLTHLKGAPKTYIYRIIRSGEVRINKKRAEAQTRLACGDVIRIPPVRLPDRASLAARVPAKDFPVLYEDDYLLVINKPAGVAVHGGSGVSYGVIEQLRQARLDCKMLELVHRLDRETSGALVIAKKRSALTVLQDQFRERQTGKTYLALVKGLWNLSVPGKNKVIDVALHKYLTAQGERRVRVTSADDASGKRSVSIVKLVELFKSTSLLAVTIKTGRTHQIRVHLTHSGYPIIGDDKYGDFELNRLFEKSYGFGRMFLHAYQLEIQHPQSGEVLQFQAPLPLECQVLLEELKNEIDTTATQI